MRFENDNYKQNVKSQLIRFKAVLNLDFSMCLKSIFQKHKLDKNATHFRIFLLKDNMFCIKYNYKWYKNIRYKIQKI